MDAILLILYLLPSSLMNLKCPFRHIRRLLTFLPMGLESSQLIKIGGGISFHGLKLHYSLLRLHVAVIFENLQIPSRLPLINNPYIPLASTTLSSQYHYWCLCGGLLDVPFEVVYGVLGGVGIPAERLE